MSKLPPRWQKLREASEVLKYAFPSPNITPREFKNDRPRVIATEDKGVVIVVINKQDYISKAHGYWDKVTLTELWK